MERIRPCDNNVQNERGDTQTVWRQIAREIQSIPPRYYVAAGGTVLAALISAGIALMPMLSTSLQRAGIPIPRIDLSGYLVNTSKPGSPFFYAGAGFSVVGACEAVYNTTTGTFQITQDEYFSFHGAYATDQGASVYGSTFGNPMACSDPVQFNSLRNEMINEP